MQICYTMVNVDIRWDVLFRDQPCIVLKTIAKSYYQHLHRNLSCTMWQSLLYVRLLEAIVNDDVAKFTEAVASYPQLLSASVAEFTWNPYHSHFFRITNYFGVSYGVVLNPEIWKLDMLPPLPIQHKQYAYVGYNTDPVEAITVVEFIRALSEKHHPYSTLTDAPRAASVDKLSKVLGIRREVD